MKKHILFLLVSCSLVTPVSAADQMRIMVSRFSNIGAANDWIAAGIEDSVINDLKRIKDVVVTSSADRQKALKEMEFQLTGVVAEAQQVKIGEIVGANVILTGTFTVLKDKIRVMARLISVEKQDVLSSAKIDGEMKNIFEVQDRIVIGILESMSAEKRSIFAPVTVGEEEKASIVSKQNLSLPAYELYAKGLNAEFTDMTAALGYFEKALAQEPDYFEALDKAASICRKISQFDKAQKYLDGMLKAIQMKKAEKSSHMADYYFNYGSLCYQQYKFPEAERNLMMSLQLRNELKFQRSPEYLKVLNNLGNACLVQRKYPEALQLYEKQKALTSELKLDKSMFAITVNMSLSSYYAAAKKEYDKALGFIEEAERIAKGINFEKTFVYADIMKIKGEILWYMRDYPKAIDCKKNGLSILKDIGQERTDIAAQLLQGLAGLYLETKKLSEAIEMYEKCQEIRREVHLESTPDYKAVADMLKRLKR